MQFALAAGEAGENLVVSRKIGQLIQPPLDRFDLLVEETLQRIK